MTRQRDNPISFQQFLNKNERKIKAIHHSAKLATGKISQPKEAKFSDLGMYLEEVSQVINRLRKWRSQTKKILDNIHKIYPEETTKEKLSARECIDLAGLIATAAQEYVELNEKYEKLIFGLEDLQCQYSFAEHAKELLLNTHQAEVLIDILEQFDREHGLNEDGVEVLAHLYDLMDTHQSPKYADLSTTNHSIN